MFPSLSERMVAIETGGLDLYHNDPFYHRAVHLVRLAEDQGGDPVTAILEALVHLAVERKRLMDAEVDRRMGEPPPATWPPASFRCP